MVSDESEDKDLKEKVKDTVADAKKDVKDAWVDTKAAAEKAGNAIETEEEKL